jgi:pimeloyl-ACP methyl ester carboxylesterase
LAVESFGQLNQPMDLVFAAQRGTPWSWPQTCPGLMATGPGLGAAVRHCLASASRSPRHDTTASAARDLDQVRKALGYNKINIYGGSYGVTLGLAYLQRYGAHVRTAVFFSGSLLNVPLWQLVPVHAQQAFDQVAARCAAVSSCARSYHPAADLATVVNRLHTHPVRVTITVPGGRWETVTITLPAFLSAVIDDYLGSADTAVLLPADLHAFARGQWAKVIGERGLASAISAAAAPTQLQEVTIRCGDAWAAMNPVQIAQQARLSLFTPPMAAAAAWQQKLCALWPHDRGVSGVVRSTVPVVFLNGTADPADPPANVAAAPRTMPNALLVSVPGGGHQVAATGCIPAQATAFILAGKPANRASWAACTRALRHEYPAFPTAP